MLASPIYQSPPPSSNSVSQNQTCRASPNIDGKLRKRPTTKIKSPFSFKKLKISSNLSSQQNSGNTSEENLDFLENLENFNQIMNGEDESQKNNNNNNQRLLKSSSKNASSNFQTQNQNCKSLNNSPLRPISVALRKKQSLSSLKNMSNLSNLNFNLSKPNQASNICTNSKSSQNLKSRKRHITDEMETDSNISVKKTILPYQHTAITTGNIGMSMYDDDQAQSQISQASCGSSANQNLFLNKNLDDASTSTLNNLSTSSLKSSFENKLRYFKRLKQLPSQLAQLKGACSGSGVGGTGSKKVNIDDAVHILEKILLEGWLWSYFSTQMHCVAA